MYLCMIALHIFICQRNYKNKSCIDLCEQQCENSLLVRCPVGLRDARCFCRNTGYVIHCAVTVVKQDRHFDAIFHIVVKKLPDGFL